MSAQGIKKKVFIRIPHAVILAVLLLFVPTAARAAVTATELTSAFNNGKSFSYLTASITPGANTLILAWVSSYNNAGVITPTLAGCGLTWVQVATVGWNTTGIPTGNITLFRAMGASPTAGIVTINFSVRPRDIAYTIVEFSGVDTSGTNGSGAIVQSTTGANDSAGTSGLTITLPSALGSGNATAGGFANFSGAASISAGASYTAFPQVTSTHQDLITEWRPDGNTIVNATQNASYAMAGIAVEIKMIALPIVKEAWEVNGAVPLASPISAAVGSTIVFLIYVKNTAAAPVTDARINDLLDEIGFQYVAGSLVRTSAATPPADIATDKQIFDATAGGTGTALTDAVDGDVASAVDTGGLPGPDRITIGAVAGQANGNLNIASHTTFALRFMVKVK